MNEALAFVAIGAACALLQPSQPRSVLATLALCIAVTLLAKK